MFNLCPGAIWRRKHFKDGLSKLWTISLCFNLKGKCGDDTANYSYLSSFSTYVDGLHQYVLLRARVQITFPILKNLLK